MIRRPIPFTRLVVSTLGLMGLLGVASAPAVTPVAPPAAEAGKPVDAGKNAQVVSAYGKLPLSFIQNDGQVDKKVKFYEKGSGHATYFTKDGVYLSLTNGHASLPLVGAYGDTPTQASAIKALESGAEGSSRKPEPKSPQSTLIKLFPLGANKNPKIVAQGMQEGKVNYFVGSDPKKWEANVSTYQAVVYQEVYPGIDMKFYGNNRQLEYDLIVQEGSDPSKIKFAFEGIDSLRVTDAGDLEIGLQGMSIYQKAPVIYQEIEGGRVAVKGRFKVQNDNVAQGKSVRARSSDPIRYTYGFEVASYDQRYPLVIDPVLVYGTYFGGGDIDNSLGIAVDLSGNAYVVGYTSSPDLPATFGTYQIGLDAFVLKLDATGSSLIYATYLSGNIHDVANGVAVDGSGNAYVVGYTSSSNFPVTVGAFDTTRDGGSDAFVVKLNPTGSSLIYATFLGGNSGESAVNYDDEFGITVDGAGNAYVAGLTNSPDFPTTLGGVDTTFNGGLDVFVVEVNPSGSDLVYGTYLGGSSDDGGSGIAIDGVGDAYVVGYTTSSDFPSTPGSLDATFSGSADGFVVKLSTAGSSLVYATYLGGGSYDRGHGIAVDGAGNAYVVGDTASSFPVTAGAYDTTFGGVIGLNTDAFVAKLNADGSALSYATYLGGNASDFGRGIAVDTSGNAYVGGGTNSPDFPRTPGAIGSVGGNDPFVVKLDASGSSLAYSDFVGGSDNDYLKGIAVDGAGNIYVTGDTYSLDVPTTVGAYDTTFTGPPTEVFVVKIDPGPPASVILSVSKTGTGGGTVTSAPAGINCGATCSVLFNPGTLVTLTATPLDSNSTFTSWSGAGCTGTGTCLVTMDVAKAVTATFTRLQDPLSVSKGGTGSGTVTSTPSGINCGAACVASFDRNSIVTLTATPDPGSFFAGWSGLPCAGTGTCTLGIAGPITVTAIFTAGAAPPISPLANISARSRVLTVDNVLIGGFIIQGTTPKTVLLRARGPSMGGAPFNIPGVLANPIMQLYSGSTVITQNDDWQTTDPLCLSPAAACGDGTQIGATAMDPCQPNPGETVAPPGCSQEAALLVTLPPGPYTAIVSGVGGGIGVGLVEVFEADTVTTARLTNISSRSRVETGNNVLIGGVIIGGTTPKTVLLRARGGSLGQAPFNIPGVLDDPFLRLYSGSTVIAQNDNWLATDPVCLSPATACGYAIQISTMAMDPCQPNPGQSVAPLNCTQEAALLVTLPPGPYTAIVSGVGGGVGVGLVEVFEVP